MRKLSFRASFLFCALAYTVFLAIGYYQISVRFGYYGFFAAKDLSAISFGGLFFLACVLVIQSLTSNKQIYSISAIWAYFISIPACVGYALNPYLHLNIALVPVMFHLTFVCCLGILSSTVVHSQVRIKRAHVWGLFALVAGAIVYFSNQISLSNLFLSIYEVRLQADSGESRLAGYAYAALSRVIIPLLAVICLYQRYYVGFLLALAALILFFTIGAVKSVLIGFVTASIFARVRDFYSLNKRISYFFLALAVLAVIEELIFKYLPYYGLWPVPVLHDFFVRRVLLFPSILSSYYYSHFDGNFLLYSELIGGANEIPEGLSISQYVGQAVMPYLTDPSVGVYVDGFVNLGVIGVILNGVVFGLLLFPLVASRVPPYFFGIVLYFVYLANTAFLSTLLFSHGLVFGVILLSMVRLQPHGYNIRFAPFQSK